ncbi:MAG: hypothetical protein ACYC8T_32440 [Myxococcaceae bacterium]
MPDTEVVAFSTDANAEHLLILQAKSTSATGAWELGSRLLRFRETGEWKNVTVGGPYATWKEYLVGGCKISVPSAYRYMAAATFPKWAVLKHGLDAIIALKEITELTATEESVEEALALVLPHRDGGEKAFGEMNGNEVEAALRLLRDQSGGVSRAPPTQKMSAESEGVRDLARQGSSQWLKPAQVMIRKIGGHEVLDVRAIPVGEAKDVFAALAKALERT